MESETSRPMPETRRGMRGEPQGQDQHGRVQGGAAAVAAAAAAARPASAGVSAAAPGSGVIYSLGINAGAVQRIKLTDVGMIAHPLNQVDGILSISRGLDGLGGAAFIMFINGTINVSNSSVVRRKSDLVISNLNTGFTNDIVLTQAGSGRIEGEVAGYLLT